MINRIKSHHTSILYYAAFSIIVICRLAQSSALVPLPVTFYKIAILVSSALFLIKILLDRHKFIELIAILTATAIFGYIYLVTDASFFIATFLAIASIKGVSIKKVVKLDILYKAIFLITHTLVFSLDYIFQIGEVFNYVEEFAKGTSYFLYFNNPNTTGLLGTWLAIDILYLKDDPKFKDFIFPTVLATLFFIITRSRTAFYSYILYIALHLIKNERMLNVLQKITYPLLAVVSLIIVAAVGTGGQIFQFLNNLFSYRLFFSVHAFSEVGMQLLPNAASANIFDKYTIDNFYVRCFIFYGLITLILFYLPHMLLPKTGKQKEKRISIVSSVYLFFEAVLANIGFCVPYLMLADGSLNKEEGRHHD